LLDQAGDHLPAWSYYLLSGRDQLLIEASLLFCLLFLLLFPYLCSSHKSMESLRYLPSTAESIPTGFFDPSHLPFYQWFGALDEAGKHPHAIDKQTAIGGMMGTGLHAGPIQAQFPPLHDLRLGGQFDDSIIEGMHGFRTNEVCPTKKGGIIGNLLKIDAREPTEHQTIIDPVLGFLETPVVQVFDNEQAQNDFYGRRVTTTEERSGMSPRQICFQLAKKDIILQESIQISEHRIGLGGHPGNPRKHIFFAIPINKHLAHLLCLDFLRGLALRLPLSASLRLTEESDHTLSDLLPGFRLDELHPTKKGGIVWNPRVSDPAEPLQQWTLADLFFGVLNPPIEELFEDKQA